jgi:ABC-type phosphate transport system substrate-binding protein
MKLLLAVAVAVLLISRPVKAEELLIIANPSVTITAPLNLGEIAAFYLLRTTTWPDGSRIIPVNREATSGARMKFTSSVLQEDNASLTTYWNQMHFMGKMPPVVQQSEQAMLAFIQRVPGSVGYITASTAPVDVKVLAHGLPSNSSFWVHFLAYQSSFWAAGCPTARRLRSRI